MGGLCKPLFSKCCILGLGLLGASVGMALGRFGVVEERWGYDPDSRVLAAARARGAVEHTSPPGPALQGAELVLLAAPVGQILQILQETGPFMPQGALVTDVGSTKKEIVAAMEKYLPAGVTGIGGHPMAGSEKSGVAAAHPLLLQDAAYILTPSQQTPPPALEKLQLTVRAMQAKPFLLEPEAHDQLAALISHLPYLVAVTLVQTLEDSGYAPALLAQLLGNGFRDTTRVAKGEPGMWSDIVRTNKTFLQDALQIFQTKMGSWQNNVETGNEKEIRKMLTEARIFRRSLDAGERKGAAWKSR